MFTDLHDTPITLLQSINMLNIALKKMISWDFPGDPAVLCASNAGGMGSIPGWGTKIPHAVAKKTKPQKC